MHWLQDLSEREAKNRSEQPGPEIDSPKSYPNLSCIVRLGHLVCYTRPYEESSLKSAAWCR